MVPSSLPAAWLPRPSRIGESKTPSQRQQPPAETAQSPQALRQAAEGVRLFIVRECGYDLSLASDSDAMGSMTPRAPTPHEERPVDMDDEDHRETDPHKDLDDWPGDQWPAA
jgi:hypothetical protein